VDGKWVWIKLDLYMVSTNKIITDTIHQVELLLEDLKQFRVQLVNTCSISSSTLFNERDRNLIYDELTHFQGQHIYIFKITESDNAIKTIIEAYLKFDKKNKPRVLGKTHNVSRFNKSSNTTSCLYVGSSKSLKSRIKQHLGDGGKRTYSLDLHHWFPKNIDVTIDIYSGNSANQQTIEMIEHGFWDAYQPQFGKRSGQ